MKKTTIVLSVIFLLWVGVVPCFAWDTEVGHPNTTTEPVFCGVTSNLDEFVIEFELAGKEFVTDDLNDGSDKPWNKNYPADAFMYTGWLRKGSIFEDYGPDHKTSNLAENNRRFLNHYYDGVSHKGLFHLEWVKKTVSFLTLGIFNNTPAITPQPTLPWAKEGVGVDGPNEWSWKKARKYELEALTSSDKGVRNENFAKMFRSVGQVAHLLEDMAQPGHVRNDAHVSMDDNETGARILNESTHEEWVKDHGNTVDVGVATVVRLNSIDDYFNQLAGLINRNFYSDDTIPLRVNVDGEIEQIGGAYAHPAIKDTDFNYYTFDNDESIVRYSAPPYDAVLDEEGNVRRTITITYMATDEVVGQVLFSAGYFEEYMWLLGDVLSSRVAFKLTDNVLKNNAELVLPMASKYAAGLIDYFFRGKIDMVSAGTGQFKFVNNSPEAISGGVFRLYYDAKDNKGTYTVRVKAGEWPVSAIIAPGKQSEPFSFTLPDAAKSREGKDENGNDIKDKYILVFNGTLGNESADVENGITGAVAGKVVTLTEEKGVWEDWEKAEVLLEVPYADSNTRERYFEFKTNKRAWMAYELAYHVPTLGTKVSINVENGSAHLYANTGNTWSNVVFWLGWWGADKTVSLKGKGCDLKLKMPTSYLNRKKSGDYSIVNFYLTFYSESTAKTLELQYALSAASDFWRCGYTGSNDDGFYGCIAVLPIGETVRDLEADANWQAAKIDEFRAAKGWSSVNAAATLEAAADWYLTRVDIWLYLHSGNAVGVADVVIDEIDFVCDEAAPGPQPAP